MLMICQCWIHMCDMLRLYVWHESFITFIRVTWIIHVWDLYVHVPLTQGHNEASEHFCDMPVFKHDSRQCMQLHQRCQHLACCSVLQCVVLQCVAMYGSHTSVFKHNSRPCVQLHQRCQHLTCCSVLQSVVLQCVAVCCSVLQCVAVICLCSRTITGSHNSTRAVST